MRTFIAGLRFSLGQQGAAPRLQTDLTESGGVLFLKRNRFWNSQIRGETTACRGPTRSAVPEVCGPWQERQICGPRELWYKGGCGEVEEREQGILFPSSWVKPCAGGMRLLVGGMAELAAPLTIAHGLEEVLPKSCSWCEFPVSVDM